MATKKKPPAPPAAPLFAVVSDCHIGNHARWGGPQAHGVNARCQLTLDALEAAVEKAGAAQAWGFFVAGDLFHTRRPEPAVIAAVQRIFSNVPAGMRVVIVPGNHDMLDADAEGGNTACAPLWEEAVIVETPRWIENVFCVPYTARVPMAQHLLDVMAREKEQPRAMGELRATTPRVLVTHVGVWDDKDASPWMRRAKDGMMASLLMDAMEEAGIDTAFTGNYHQHKVWTRGERTICQVGTLAPGGFGDEGLVDRGLMVTSSGRGFDKHPIPGPRFVISRGWRPLVSQGTEPGNTVFVRQVGGDEVPSDLRGDLGGYELVSDVVEKRNSEGEAAGPAPQSPLEAIRQHVEGMQLADGVGRAEVLALVEDAWAKGI